MGLQSYFKGLYQRTMRQAYGKAIDEICLALQTSPGRVLDCGAGEGAMFETLNQRLSLERDRYTGVEWNPPLVDAARAKGLNVLQGDLNRALEFADESFGCVFALSVLEHLLNPCRFLREVHRVLESQGVLVILTPNISTYFTAALILAGKMPSSGPHPDSDALIKNEEVFKVSDESLQPDTEIDTPSHRHLVVFSYRVLKRYLRMLGFREIEGRGFGLYPFPNFAQPFLERVDPWHCHQMVFVARK